MVDLNQTSYEAMILADRQEQSERKKYENKRRKQQVIICGTLVCVLVIIFVAVYVAQDGAATNTDVLSPLWQWQASLWAVRGLCSSRISVSREWNIAGFKQKLQAASQEISGLGITATLWDHATGDEVLQFTVGENYCTDVVWCNFTAGSKVTHKLSRLLFCVCGLILYILLLCNAILPRLDFGHHPRSVL
jgi:hypothetical protein